MIVDIVTPDDGITHGESVMRYTTDICPRVGETISQIVDDKKTLQVLAVDHLVKPHVMGNAMFQELITVTAMFL